MPGSAKAMDAKSGIRDMHARSLKSEPASPIIGCGAQNAIRR
jgi:hypothetical protein